MPGLSFKPQFESSIQSGAKRHTIRARQRRFRAGDPLFLWVQQRTPDRRWLGYTTVRAVEDIEIDLDRAPGRLAIDVDGRRLDVSEAEQLARADGFEDMLDMGNFWLEYNELPFEGQIVHWFYPLQERPTPLKSGRKKRSTSL